MTLKLLPQDGFTFALESTPTTQSVDPSTLSCIFLFCEFMKQVGTVTSGAGHLFRLRKFFPYLSISFITFLTV